MMSRLENIWLNVVGGLATLMLVSVLEGLTGFFRNMSLDNKLSVLGLLLLASLLIGLRILWTVHKIGSPRKPSLIRAHAEPDTYLFLHGQWRRIPDWQTRDYLAHLLGFRPGEEDITLKPKDEVDKLRKGPPLESVFTYARK